MARFPKTITRENFADAENALRRAERSVKQTRLARRIARPLASLLFVLLSFLLVFGAFLELSSPEEGVVFEKLGAFTDLWNAFSAPFFALKLEGALLWLAMTAAVFLLPLLLSALVTIVVKLCVRQTVPLEEGTATAQAKALYLRAEAAHENNRHPDVSSAPWRLLFTLIVGGFLAFAFLTLKMDVKTDTLFGALFFLVLLYFVYALPFGLCSALCGLFHRTIVGLDSFKLAALEYWTETDPDAESARSLSSDEPSLTPDENGIVELDSFTWTPEYVKAHEARCSEVLLNTLEVSKELLSEGNHDGARSGFRHVVIGLFLLSDLAPDHYLPPLYANLYALARIDAFGAGDREGALENARRACEKAEECGTPTALRDLVKLRDFYDALSSGKSLSDIREEYGHSYPGDILSSD